MFHYVMIIKQRLWSSDDKGTTWTMKLAMQKRTPKATHNKCPLCNKSDSAGNLLGGCSHKEMKALLQYIARHDKAIREVLKQVLNGQHGAHYVIADTGTLEGLQQLGVHNTRIPAFILQDDNWPAQDTGDCPHGEQTRTHERDKLRPDICIMLVELADIVREAYMAREEMPLLNATVQNSWTRKVWIVEGGYPCMYTAQTPDRATNIGATRHSMNAYRHCCRLVGLR